jgi:hypothetical protein
MSEKPILFSGPMIRALLDGSKTQTRRIIRFDDPMPTGTPTLMDNEDLIYWAWGPDHYICPYGVPGDRLWVRETFRDENPEGSKNPSLVEFAAECRSDCMGWRPSIFMPRWACRLHLEITEVRVERLQDISESGAMAEGVEKTPDAENLAVDPFRNKPSWRGYLNGGRAYRDSARDSYASLWDSLNAKRGFGWDTNPWVWVMSFRRVEP